MFCFGPLPQERARIRVTAVKPKYAIGELVRILSPSPYRTTPFCPVFGACGGCQLQHLSYPAQLAWKTDTVRGALQRIGGFHDVVVRDTIGMTDPRAYRNKMSLVVEHRGGTPTIGFYKQRSHDIVPIDSCPIVTPQLSDSIARLNRARAAPEINEALEVARHVVARNARSSGESVVTLTTQKLAPEVARAADSLMRAFPGAVGLTNSYELASENAIMGRRHRTLVGRAEIEEVLDGVRYRVSAGSFFQVNVEIVGRIFEFMRRDSNTRGASSISIAARNLCALFRAPRLSGLRHRGERAGDRRGEGNAALNGLENGRAFDPAASKTSCKPPRRAPRCARPTSSSSIRRARGATRRRWGRSPRRRAVDLVPFVRSGDAGPGFEVPGRQRIPARHRAAVRHVSADGARRDAGDAVPRGRGTGTGQGVRGHRAAELARGRLRPKPIGVSRLCHPRRSTSATSPSWRASR